MCSDFLPFRGCVIFRCGYTPAFVYPFIHQWTLGLLLLFLVIVNNTTMNMVYKCVLVPAFNFWGYESRRGIAGSYNSMFNFMRNCHMVFHSHHTILHSYQQCTRVPNYPQFDCGYNCCFCLFVYF